MWGFICSRNFRGGHLLPARGLYVVLHPFIHRGLFQGRAWVPCRGSRASLGKEGYNGMLLYVILEETGD